MDFIDEKQREAEAILFQALELLEEERLHEANRLLEKAHEIDPKNPKISSYYGFTVAMAHDLMAKGLQLCKEALQSGYPDPAMFLNLAKLLLKAGNRRDAVAALQRGLKIDPGNRPILTFWKKIGLRRKPALAFLGRDNPVNRVLGRMTYRGRGAEEKKKKKK